MNSETSQALRIHALAFVKSDTFWAANQHRHGIGIERWNGTYQYTELECVIAKGGFIVHQRLVFEHPQRKLYL